MPTTAEHILFQRRPVERILPAPTWRVPVPNAAVVYWIVALMCLAAISAGSLGGFQMRPAFGDDSSIYIASAQSMTQGTGYRLIYYTSAPPAQVFPIGYPLILSSIFQVLPVGPTSILVARLLNIACVLVWVEAARRLLLRTLSPPLAACAAVAAALTPLAIKMTGQVKSDMVFAALLVIAIVVAVSDPKSNEFKRLLVRGMILGAIAACAMLVRTIGFTLILGLMLEMLLRRRWSQLFGFCVAAAVLLCPWLLWSFLHNGGTFRSYTAENVITWRTPLANFWTLATVTAPSTGFAPIETPAWHAVATRLHLLWMPGLFGLALVGFVMVGWASLLLRGHAVALVLASYMAIVFFWWFEPSRFVIPILPLLVFCGAVGAKTALSRISVPAHKIALISATICILGAVLVDTVKLQRVWKYGELEGAQAATEWDQMRRGLDWIQQNTPPDSLVFSTYPAGVYLFTGRHTLDLNNSSHIGAAWTPSYSADLDQRLKKVDASKAVYVYATADRDSNVLRYVADHPNRVELQWASQNGLLSIYQVISAHGGHGAPAP